MMTIQVMKWMMNIHNHSVKIRMMMTTLTTMMMWFYLSYNPQFGQLMPRLHEKERNCILFADLFFQHVAIQLVYLPPNSTRFGDVMCKIKLE